MIRFVAEAQKRIVRKEREGRKGEQVRNRSSLLFA
jgi:hypothetical protein